MQEEEFMVLDSPFEVASMLAYLINNNRQKDAVDFFERNIKSNPQVAYEILSKKIGINEKMITGDLTELSDELIDFLVSSRFFIKSESIRRTININVFRNFNKFEYREIFAFARPVVLALSDKVMDEVISADLFFFLNVFKSRGGKLTDFQSEFLINACKSNDLVMEEVYFQVKMGKLPLCEKNKKLILDLAAEKGLTV